MPSSQSTTNVPAEYIKNLNVSFAVIFVVTIVNFGSKSHFAYNVPFPVNSVVCPDSIAPVSSITLFPVPALPVQNPSNVNPTYDGIVTDANCCVLPFIVAVSYQPVLYFRYIGLGVAFE